MSAFNFRHDYLFHVAHNCTEAGKLGCHVNETENEFCAVTTSEGVCYCDSTCVVNGTCCDDAEEMFRPGIITIVNV